MWIVGSRVKPRSISAKTVERFVCAFSTAMKLKSKNYETITNWNKRILSKILFAFSRNGELNVVVASDEQNDSVDGDEYDEYDVGQHVPDESIVLDPLNADGIVASGALVEPSINLSNDGNSHAESFSASESNADATQFLEIEILEEFDLSSASAGVKEESVKAETIDETPLNLSLMQVSLNESNNSASMQVSLNESNNSDCVVTGVYELLEVEEE